jgi:hypothetical protein
MKTAGFKFQFVSPNRHPGLLIIFEIARAAMRIRMISERADAGALP